MKRLFLSVIAMLTLMGARADEGMWMISNLSAKTDSILHSMGIELTHDQIFSTEHPALNNVIVQFGGFCSGSVVSPDGLVFTNHHCGYGSIQDHSTTEHDYLKNGFFAKKLKDELPNEDLYVDFHLNTYDVTDKLLAATTPDMDDMQRMLVIDSVATVLQEAIEDSVNGIHGEVVPYYKGSKYYMSVYQRYSDVRLVFAPPQCLGKHGGDTDNWMWPRQTCDFSVFRIYADKNNKPAEYSKDNVPYKPVKYAHISLQGYQPGDLCMTFGYPGNTDRYLSSYGIENTMRTVNDNRIQVRGVKQAIMTDAMNSSDALRIMYSSKYAQSSNYWKFSIGQNKALQDLGVIAEKQALEKEILEWAKQKPEERGKYIGILDSLKEEYARSYQQQFAMNLWQESFWSGSDILAFAIKQMIGMAQGKQGDFKKEVEKSFKDIDINTDKKIFAALAKNYVEHVPDSSYLPEYVQVVDSLFNGDYNAYTDFLFSKSIFARPADLAQVESLAEVGEDPIFMQAIDLVTLLYKMYGASPIDHYEQLLGDALREMNRDKEYYPDANFTLRMSYGIVEGYSPSKDLTYECFTPSQSIIDKFEKQGSNPDYELIPEVYAWLKKGDFGKKYIDSKSKDLQLCFLTNNDITGGNSGSGMYDKKGRLIGLAFDGNWEAMSSDLKFDTRLQRCIGVDIRYVLSVIEKYGKAKRLIKELTLE